MTFVCCGSENGVCVTVWFIQVWSSGKAKALWKIWQGHPTWLIFPCNLLCTFLLISRLNTNLQAVKPVRCVGSLTYCEWFCSLIAICVWTATDVWIFNKVALCNSIWDSSRAIALKPPLQKTTLNGHSVEKIHRCCSTNTETVHLDDMSVASMFIANQWLPTSKNRHRFLNHLR